MRKSCNVCERPALTCYCRSIKKFDNSTRIYILQYPSESQHHLSTAKMAELSFRHVKIFKGIDFTNLEEINRLPLSSTILVYPSISSFSLSDMQTKPGRIRNLIILDGTWRKTYKIYQLSKNLHCFTQVQFDPIKPSILELRKVPRDNYLSTFESIAFCLEKIEKKSFNNFETPLKYLQDKIRNLSIKKEI